jgi:hypothetical protein
MPVHIPIKVCSDLINCLIGLSDSHSDNLETLYLKGNFDDVIVDALLKIIIEIIKFNNPSILKIRIDRAPVELDEIENEISNGCPSEWDFSLEKGEFLKAFGYDSEITNYKEYIFFSLNSLMHPSKNILGLKNPFVKGPLNGEYKVRIQAIDIKTVMQGDNLLLCPIGQTKADSLKDSKANLPIDSKISSSIRILSSELSVISPSSFHLKSGNSFDYLYSDFRIAYLQTLFSCICTHFHSYEELVIDGIKKFSASVCPTKYTQRTEEQILEIEKAICWVYSDDDFETKKTLFSDRVSLEIRSGSNLLDLASEIIEEALNQAKSKYKYVLAERNDDYRKELRDLYSDVKKFTDNINEACESLTKGLITDLLSLGFIFTITMFSRVVVSDQIDFSSMMINYVFKAIGLYLILSFTFRFWNSSVTLKNSEALFDDWAIKLHNHVSTEEILKIKRKLTIQPKNHFDSVHAVVGAIHLLLALVSFKYDIFFR